MNVNFCHDLQSQILEAISHGKSNFVFWGFNENTIKVLAELHNLGLLESYVSGVVDSTPEKQGKTIYDYQVLPPNKVKSLEISVLVITHDADKEEYLKLDFVHLSKGETSHQQMRASQKANLTTKSSRNDWFRPHIRRL